MHRRVLVPAMPNWKSALHERFTAFAFWPSSPLQLRATRPLTNNAAWPELPALLPVADGRSKAVAAVRSAEEDRLADVAYCVPVRAMRAQDAQSGHQFRCAAAPWLRSLQRARLQGERGAGGDAENHSRRLRAGARLACNSATQNAQR